MADEQKSRKGAWHELRCIIALWFAERAMDLFPRPEKALFASALLSFVVKDLERMRTR